MNLDLFDLKFYHIHVYIYVIQTIILYLFSKCQMNSVPRGPIYSQIVRRVLSLLPCIDIPPGHRFEHGTVIAGACTQLCPLHEILGQCDPFSLIVANFSLFTSRI